MRQPSTPMTAPTLKRVQASGSWGRALFLPFPWPYLELVQVLEFADEVVLQVKDLQTRADLKGERVCDKVHTHVASMGM